jgi:asparagine synthase (glutamine-hydrolysing)
MCGILAHLPSHREIDRGEFADRLSVQAHRGPDGQHVWISPDRRVALGHNLLSLTGSCNVRQPFSSEDKKITASVNGEFYGHKEIRRNLQAKGHRFISDGDSEIVLHLYEEYGERCLDFLRGEFAFIIWDERRRSIFAARDRFGVKPLQYQLDSAGLILASEAKAILHGKRQSRWDPTSLSRVLTHQYLAPDETLFDGIRQLPPAHFLTYGDGTLRLTKYWDPAGDVSSSSPEELRKLLEYSVIERIHPQGVFSLSGGIDSSAVVRLASRHQERPVTAFSVSFDEPAYDELNLVTSTADETGAKVTPVVVSRRDLFEHLPQAVTMSEGLAINGQLVGKFLLNHAIQKSGHRVVISGEGADEALLGYAHLLSDHRPGHSKEHPLQAGIMLPGSGSSITVACPQWLQKWPTFLKAKFSFCQQFSSLLEPDFNRELRRSDIILQTMEVIEQLGFHTPESDTPHQSAWLWTRLALANAILKTLGDGTEMPHGIEGRVPFLDHRFFEHAWNIPTSEKLTDSQTKVVFRKSTRSILPPSIAEREKHPFLAPPLLGDRSLAHEIRDHLQSADFRALTFFKQSATLAWFDRICRGSASEQQAADPILQSLLSILFLQNSYKLTL